LNWYAFIWSVQCITYISQATSRENAILEGQLENEPRTLQFTEISTFSASSIFTTWINLLFVEFKELCCLPKIDNMFVNKASAFRDFGDVHMVMDCTELFTEKPSSLSERKHTFSNYKHHQTFKFLVVLSTHAQPCVVYVSRMYGGRASDKLITAQSQDFLDYAKEMGGKIMCDKGFAGNYKMTPLGIDLVMPAFKGRDRLQ
jgi:hypothetical protein